MLSPDCKRRRLIETEFDELKRLRSEATTLRRGCDHLIQTLHDIVHRPRQVNQVDSLNPPPSIEKPSSLAAFPATVLLHVFRFCDREDVDRCQLVCRQWRSIIEAHQNQLSRRDIRLKIVGNDSWNATTITVLSGSKKIEFTILPHRKASEELKKKIVNALQYSTIHSFMMCNLDLTEVIAQDIASIIECADVIFIYVELVSLFIGRISASSFQRFVGDNLQAEEYYLFDISDANPDYFNNVFFQKPGIAQAMYFCAWSLTNASDEYFNLAVGEDGLLDNFFGKNCYTREREQFLLGRPSITSSFVYSALMRFKYEDDLSFCLPYADFTDVILQTVVYSPFIEIDHVSGTRQEYSVKNVKSNRTLEACVCTHLNKNDGLCKITFMVV